MNNLFKRAKAIGVTAFHGTDASNIPGILEKGLLSRKPNMTPHGVKAVYLTNNIETAARYCRNFEKPIILELYISSPKRVNKLDQDALDRDESAYDNAGDYGSFWNDDLFIINDAVKEILGTDKYSDPVDLPDEIEKFRGFNLYGAIKAYAKENGLDLDKIKKRIKEILPPQELEYLKIGDSGFISLLPTVYDQFHQMTFKSDIPAVAIKAVWIPKNRLKEGITGEEDKSFGRRLIPGDIQDLNSVTDGFVRRYSPSDIDLESMESVIEELERVDVFGFYKKKHGTFPSFIDDLKNLKNKFEEASSEEEQEEIQQEFHDAFIDLDPIDPGVTAGKEVWVKFTVNLESLKETGGLYRAAKVWELATAFIKFAQAI